MLLAILSHSVKLLLFTWKENVHAFAVLFTEVLYHKAVSISGDRKDYKSYLNMKTDALFLLSVLSVVQHMYNTCAGIYLWPATQLDICPTTCKVDTLGKVGD